MDTRNEKLCCCWEKWEVVNENKLKLTLPMGNCTDMMGAVTIAKTLMHDVKQIIIVNKKNIINVYKLINDNWKSVESYSPY